MLYIFSPRRGLILTPKSAGEILEGRSDVPVNLGEAVARATYGEGGVLLAYGGEEYSLDVEDAVRLARSDKLLFLGRGESYFVEARSGGHYYKLRYLGERVWPTLEIDGVHMHNIVGTDPLRDARRKVGLAGVRRGHRVLDICTGLGYTAVMSLRRGASVVTIEKSREVLWIAEHNPYSTPLAKAEVVLGDAYYAVDEIEDRFDRIIHDPPVFSHAGLLYSGSFYRKLYSLLKPGGRLFHYTGAPGSRRGVDIQKGVARRLRESGFRVDRIIRGYGLVATRT